MEPTGKKKEELCALMDKLAAEDIMVAFSGGVDSSLLLKAACDSAGKTGKRFMPQPCRPSFIPPAIWKWQRE